MRLIVVSNRLYSGILIRSRLSESAGCQRGTNKTSAKRVSRKAGLKQRESSEPTERRTVGRDLKSSRHGSTPASRCRVASRAKPSGLTGREYQWNELCQLLPEERESFDQVSFGMTCWLSLQYSLSCYLLLTCRFHLDRNRQIDTRSISSDRCKNVFKCNECESEFRANTCNVTKETSPLLTSTNRSRHSLDWIYTIFQVDEIDTEIYIFSDFLNPQFWNFNKTEYFAMIVSLADAPPKVYTLIESFSKFVDPFWNRILF